MNMAVLNSFNAKAPRRQVRKGFSNKKSFSASFASSHLGVERLYQIKGMAAHVD